MDFNEIKFRPGSNNRVKVEKVKKWRGDHSGCNRHRDNTCRAAYGWTIDNNTWRIRADFAGVSVEPTMLGTSKIEGKKGAYEMPTWQAKGWVEPEEAEGVLPHPQVCDFLIKRLCDERRMFLEQKKRDYGEIEKDVAKLERDARAANKDYYEAAK
jgi:hypothetical protein